MRSVIASVELSTGVMLPYVEQGDPAGVPVICLHGITDSWRSFEVVLPHLPASIRALALTQRGHGDAERPETGYRPRDFAADVAAFMDALEIERAIIVGHSLGSTVAQCFALAYPERALGLVLLGTFITYIDNPGVVEFQDAVVATLEDPIDPAIAREFQESTVAKPVAPGLIDLAVSESLKVPARVWKAAFAGCLELDHRARLGSIAAPTLIIWGDQDIFSPRADQDELLASIPHARLLIYEGYGHAMHWEDPVRVAADLAAFIGKIVG